MKYIALTFKNIKKFIIGHPVFFIFLMFVQIVCFVEVLISSGMAYNINYKEQEIKMQYFNMSLLEENAEIYSEGAIKKDDGKRQWRYFHYDPVTNESELVDKAVFPGSITVKEFKPLLEKLLNDLHDYHICQVNIRFKLGQEIDCDNDYLGDYYSFHPDYYTPQDSDESELLENYLDSSEKVVFAPLYTKGGQPDPITNFKLGESAVLGGNEYKCIGNLSSYIIPYNALSDDFAVDVISLKFDEPLSSNDINNVINTSRKYFNIDLSQSEIPDPIDPEEIQFGQMLFIISAVVMVIVLLAIAKLYSFILSQRKNNLMIMRLCGCTRGKVHVVYMLEIFLTMSLSTVIGTLIFKYFILKPVAQMYPSFNEFFIEPVYWAIIAGYMTIAVIILAFSVIPSTKVNITEMKRKA